MRVCSFTSSPSETAFAISSFKSRRFERLRNWRWTISAAPGAVSDDCGVRSRIAIASSSFSVENCDATSALALSRAAALPKTLDALSPD